MTMRNLTALALTLAIGSTLFSGVALAQFKGAFPGGAQSVVLPYYVTLVEAMVKGNQSGVTQELKPARGSTPERFILTISVSNNSFSNGALTLKNGYQTLATRTSFKVKLIVDSPAQHPSLYQYLLHCSNLAGSAFNGYRHGPTDTCTIGKGLGKIYLHLKALPNQPMSLTRINNHDELIINLTNLQYDALKCST
jgi:hypothetical protein